MRNIADRVGHLQLILNLGMSGSVPKRVEKQCAGIECNGCNTLAPCGVCNIADRVGHLQLILNLGMGGSVPKRVEKLCADIECNGCNRVLPPCSNHRI